MALSISDRHKAKAEKHIKNFIVKFLIFILLIGFSYVIFYPFLFKILAAFMSETDMNNPLVDLIPVDWSWDNFKYVFKLDGFGKAFLNSAVFAILCATFSTISAAMVGYGIAKFKFKGVGILTVIILIIMLMPIQTLYIPIYLGFRYFNLFGILGSEGLNLVDSVWPLIIMSATSLGFRSGIYVVLMRQYYIGVPGELIEAAYVDGSGPYRTFIQIILPMAKSMLIVVFSLSFAWQWTDTFYSGFLYGNVEFLPSLAVKTINALDQTSANLQYQLVRGNTMALVALIPLIILYCILQKQIIQGIERSGLVG